MHHASFDTDITNIKSFLKSWEKLSPESIQFDRLAGLSNVTWKVTALDDDVQPSSIVYRKFGDNDSVINREQENYVFNELARKGIGAFCYGGNMKFRLEQFFDSRSLDSSEVNNQNIRRNVAKSLASLHKVDLDALDKNPMFKTSLEQGSMFKLVQEKAKKDIFTVSEKRWIQEILSLATEEEISFVKDILPKGKNSVVFSHNDLHALNILMLEKSEKLILIDYEYSTYNYRGYDIANFFNEATISYTNPEYPFYTLDLEKYPCQEDLRDFVKHYLFFFKFDGTKIDEVKALNDDEYFRQYIIENDSMEEFEREVNDILEEVKVCAMFSHFYWVLWSIIMSKNPEVDFDYIHYAKSRYDAYQKLKEEYNSSASSKSQNVKEN